MGRVIVFGSLSQDMHLAVERHPRSGETIMSGDIEYRFGGKGANQAVAAALAGAHTMLIGKVGDDPQGDEYVERLGRFGVETSRMALDANRRTGTAITFVDAAGENMIVVAPGANSAMSIDDLARLDDIGGGDVLLMPLECHLTSSPRQPALPTPGALESSSTSRRMRHYGGTSSSWPTCLLSTSTKRR
jgi:ribokinase